MVSYSAVEVGGHMPLWRTAQRGGIAIDECHHRQMLPQHCLGATEGGLQAGAQVSQSLLAWQTGQGESRNEDLPCAVL